MLHMAMTAHQLSSQEVWMVGDSLPDLYAGYNAGVGKVVLVEDLPVPKMITQAVKISHLEELIAMLKARSQQAV